MIDHLSDKSLQVLHTLSKQFLDGELPSFVKAADVAAEKPVANAPLSVYGDPAIRQFPCHTKVATWLSCLYFWGLTNEKWASSCPKDVVGDRLTKAANYWGILSDVQKLQSVISEKSASPNRHLTDDDYALTVNYGNERLRRFPIVNALSVKKAAANLHRFRVSYPYVWRKKAAVKILERAMKYNAQLEPSDLDYVVKAAGVYPAENEDVAKKVAARAYLFPDEIKLRMRKAAEMVVKSSQLKIDTLCELLDAADRQFKKLAMYNDGLETPEEVCYQGVQAKAASAATMTVSLTTGATYELEAIKAAGLEPFSVLAPDYVSAVAANDKGDLDMAKVAEVLPTLPQDDAQVLERAFKAVGVNPLAKEAGMSKVAFDLNKISMQGFAEVLGAPKETDFIGRFNLRHGQGLHEELAKKQAKSKR